MPPVAFPSSEDDVLSCVPGNDFTIISFIAWDTTALSKCNLPFGNISKVVCRELVHVILTKVTRLTFLPTSFGRTR